MSVFGGMSKGERNRIKIRVRSSMQAQAKVEGRYLGGRPPYGYQLADAGPHPNPAKAADGKRLHVLAKDPITAPVVERIFHRYLNGMGVFLIAQTLTDEGLLSPSAYDRARNRHRTGIAWSKGAVQAILANPRYAGYQVWNKQRKAETLLDVDDVALGYETKLKWNERDQWVWSDRPAHPAIVDKATFHAVQERRARRGPSSDRPQIRTPHPYALRSLLVHHQCGAGHLEPRACSLPLPLPAGIRHRQPDRPPAVGLPARGRDPTPGWPQPSPPTTSKPPWMPWRPSSPRRRQPAPTRTAGKSPPATASSPSTALPWKPAPTPPS